MISGMTLLTFVHVVLSLVGIVAGFVVARSMIEGRRLDGWTAVFLVTTLLTSVTAFMFPFTQMLPSHVVGIVSLIVLAPALYARYGTPLTGPWPTVYVTTAIAALYLNVFVLVAQMFQKVPFLRAMAPTQSEAPFAIAQIAVLAAFVWLGMRALKGYRTATPQPA